MCATGSSSSADEATVTAAALTNVNDIKIRPYQDKDEEQVHAVFLESMESVTPFVTLAVVKSPLFFVPVGALTWAVHWMATKALSFSTTKDVVVQSCSATRIESIVPLVVSLGTAVVTVVLLHLGLLQKVRKELHSGLEEDLADIKGTYADKGGTFLVAVDPASDKVVGTIGGDHKEAVHGKGVFEMRRMCVVPNLHNRGIGKRLVSALEKEICAAGGHRIYLTCSSIQVPAHRLYAKTGFANTDKDFPSQKADRAPWLIRQVFSVYRFEKKYAENQSF